MSKQLEAPLENDLLVQLQQLGYELTPIHNEATLLENLKKQLEKHNKKQLNNTPISPTEFNKIVNILNKGNVFEKAKTLRAKQHIVRDNGDNLYFDFINTDEWCQNQFQVANQIKIKGKYDNRYDVTLLINGLPLVQIELKRRGLELKEAFNQINRYQKHSYNANNALFQYIQIFVISNGVNAKYYSNNRGFSFKKTFYWTDEANKRLTNITSDFTSSFLHPCHISKMICKYIVLSEANKCLMVLRPYQYYAVESLIDRVRNSNRNGYIWHTTGSGKTLTSFKASQIIMNLPQVKKVVFVVDRKDLDYQTSKEFNSFSEGCIDGTGNTKQLVSQFADDTKLIVTTIQKLNTAISKPQYLSAMERIKNERIVFIFDECHRSQFGETHNKINQFFTNTQLFGFTGTPIFADNAVTNERGKRTTTELFGECLHKYVITDAIRDGNVLKFSVEYVGRYRKKDTNATEIDIDVEDIDTKELMESPKRLEKITNYIIANHKRKTHNRNFTAMFCVNSVDTLIKYYDIFQKKKEAGEHNLRIATIFSYTNNEDDIDANGFIPEELSVVEEPAALYGLHMHSREKLDEYIEHYNQLFQTKCSAKDNESFYLYYNNISEKVKAGKVDILLVVNMFLTGFDCETLNTLYVDKNLKYHGLIQAYSRTNRISNEQKSQGNIIVFRNLKSATDEAITLFSNKDAVDTILMGPVGDYIQKFNEAFAALQKVAPTVDSVNDLADENEELAFVKAFRDLIRIKNVLASFSDFNWDDLDMGEQVFEDYKSKYLDLWEAKKHRTQKEKVSILDDVDFEVELTQRDEITVAYIIGLIVKLKLSKQSSNTEKIKKRITTLLNSEAKLRSKRELIEEFIYDNFPQIKESGDIQVAFDNFLTEKYQHAFNQLIEDENLSTIKTKELIKHYLYTKREPLRDDLLDLMEGEKPKILDRKSTGDRILRKITLLMETYIDEFKAADYVTQ